MPLEACRSGPRTSRRAASVPRRSPARTIAFVSAEPLAAGAASATYVHPTPTRAINLVSKPRASTGAGAALALRQVENVGYGFFDIGAVVGGAIS